MDEPIYTGQSDLDISKVLLYLLKYGYMILKLVVNKVLFIYMNTNSVIPLYTDVYKDIGDDVEKCFSTSNYDEGRRKRPFLVGKKQSNRFDERWERW